LTLQTFGYYFSEYIFMQRLADTLSSAIGAAFQYVSMPAILAGTEAVFQRSWGSLTAAYVWGTFFRAPTDSLRPMPKIPPLRLQLRLEYPLRASTPQAVVTFFAPQHRAFRAYRTEIPTPGYVLVDFRLQRQVKAYVFSLGVTNLLNVQYQSHLSIFRQWGPEGIQAPGRAFTFAIERSL
jgi:outer membrane receptor protein involved in Fe transport